MKILLALSGGVDSAVCARLLQEQGHSVSGLVIRFSPAHEAAVAAAQRAADELGIPLAVADCAPLFEHAVVGPFCADYAAGRTPNPCVVCNPQVKFKVLLNEANRQGADGIASGHYARVAKKGGVFYVRMAESAKRDQSYMLYRLPQQVLSRLHLPVGLLDKPSIRSVAQQAGLSSADAPDSQEICFIPGGNYAEWLARRGVAGTQGRFISPGGEILGLHRGITHYTVGQRRGLGLALGRPAFVKAITPNGDILLAWGADINAQGVVLRDFMSAGGLPLTGGHAVGYTVKTRSMAKPVPCRLQGDPQAPTVMFDSSQRAPAPGQHAVLYSGQLVVGGGVIDAVHWAE